MPAGLNNTALLDLPLPVEGYFDGTWGDLVNNALTNYLDIAIAGTLSLTGDSPVTLDNTAGDDSASNISSTSAQYAVIKITGTSTTKIITVGTAGSPAVSKIYIVDNAGAGGVVTFKAYGQTGISVAVGEKCVAYFNGTDFVKVASSVADGVTSVGGTGTVNGITLTGTVTSTGNLTLGGTLSNVNLTSQVTGTLPIANGGTGTTSTTFANLTTNVTGTLPIANGGTGTTSTTFANLTTNVTGTLPVANGGTGITSLGTGVATFLGTPSSANLAAAVTDETGSGSLVFATSPTLGGTPLAPTASTGTNTTQIATTAFVQNQIGAIAAGVSSFSAGTTGLTPSTGTTGNVTLAGTLAVANGGTGVTTSTGTGSTVLSVSPALTGTPTVPTAANGTNTTQAASTAFVLNQIGAIAAGVTTFSAGTTGLTPSTGTSGNVTLAGTLAVANGGTGVTTSTGSGSVVLNTSPSLVTPILGTPQSGNFSTGTFTWPTFNQNTTGTAAGLSATLVAGSGGTGLTSPGTVGNVLTSTGSAWVSSAPSGGAAAGGGIYVNNDVISVNYTIASGQNGFSVGPMTISDGYAITVSSGQSWVII